MFLEPNNGVGIRAQVIFSGRNWNNGSSLDTMPAINFNAVFGGNNHSGSTPDGMCQVNGGGRTRPVTSGGGTNTNSFVAVDGIRFYFPTSTIRSVENSLLWSFPKSS